MASGTATVSATLAPNAPAVLDLAFSKETVASALAKERAALMQLDSAVMDIIAQAKETFLRGRQDCYIEIPYPVRAHPLILERLQSRIHYPWNSLASHPNRIFIYSTRRMGTAFLVKLLTRRGLVRALAALTGPNEDDGASKHLDEDAAACMPLLSASSVSKGSAFLDPYHAHAPVGNVVAQPDDGVTPKKAMEKIHLLISEAEEFLCGSTCGRYTFESTQSCILDIFSQATNVVFQQYLDQVVCAPWRATASIRLDTETITYRWRVTVTFTLDPDVQARILAADPPSPSVSSS